MTTSSVIVNLDTCRTTDSTKHHWRLSIRHCNGNSVGQSAAGSDVINSIVLILFSLFTGLWYLLSWQ